MNVFCVYRVRPLCRYTNITVGQKLVFGRLITDISSACHPIIVPLNGLVPKKLQKEKMYEKIKKHKKATKVSSKYIPSGVKFLSTLCLY